MPLLEPTIITKDSTQYSMMVNSITWTDKSDIQMFIAPSNWTQEIVLDVDDNRHNGQTHCVSEGVINMCLLSM